MVSEFAPAMLFVLENEVPKPIPDVGGGFTDDPFDRGGSTVYGLSLAIRHREGLVPSDFEIPDFSNANLRTVRREVAERIYRRIYWDRFRYFEIESQDVATKLFDAAVNLNWAKGSKCVTAHRLAQLALHGLGVELERDGVLGPRTICALNGEDPQRFLAAFVGALVSHYEAIIRAAHEAALATGNPLLEQEKWRGIWMRRARRTF